MLVDVKQSYPDPMTSYLVATIGGGSASLTRLECGMYLCNHFNVEHIVAVKNEWTDDDYQSLGDIPEYGVCDSPDQAVEYLGLRDIDVPIFVSFVRLRREDQPSSGGWRWHKWGPYIGDQEPRCEYLHDEPDIDEVYTFHIYQPKL